MALAGLDVTRTQYIRRRQDTNRNLFLKSGFFFRSPPVRRSGRGIIVLSQLSQAKQRNYVENGGNELVTLTIT